MLFCYCPENERTQDVVLLCYHAIVFDESYNHNIELIPAADQFPVYHNIASPCLESAFWTPHTPWLWSSIIFHKKNKCWFGQLSGHEFKLAKPLKAC